MNSPELTLGGTPATLIASGPWTVAQSASLERLVATLPSIDPQRRNVVIDISGVESLLIIAEPISLIMFETHKILVRPPVNEDPTFASADWSDSTPKLVHEKIIQAFENAGLVVARASENVAAENQLFLDLRKFQLSVSAAPTAEVEFGAKIVSTNGRLLGARLFEASAAAKNTTAPAAVDALNEAFGKCAIELVQWTANLIR
jgi:ABC-type uncharacterized transport system auxiliary subunit